MASTLQFSHFSSRVRQKTWKRNLLRLAISITNKEQVCFGAYVLLCSEVRAFDRLTGSPLKITRSNRNLKGQA